MKNFYQKPLFNKFCIAVVCALTAINVYAAPSVSGDCEYIASPDQRSRANVKAKGLNRGAVYTIEAGDGISGASVANRKGEAEISFDSNIDDIRRGDSPISSDSLIDGTATFTVRNGTTGASIATGSAVCKLG